MLFVSLRPSLFLEQSFFFWPEPVAFRRVYGT